ncbi:GPI mannosyltransferase 1 [Puccinia graminis f. sp. tritici]|uniref:GPI mannosyltransferase 1 n=1 Tax=Puccinia graminis f. sp. tritici TaxID=56615 RepID=A0A5B0SJR7_PUCGR|nr:GPI mannosyltransferase 1 [Puccinia graminis f. sp. tritici]
MMMKEFLLFGLIPGFMLRLGLICYSVYHDNRSALKYTDIDYQVFSDAARALLSGPNGSGWFFGSPYDRATYRYTPLLALILTPNEFIHPCWGKALFGSADLVIGILLYRLCPRGHSAASHGRLVSLIWLLNPFVINISTRGSSESLLGVAIIGFLYLAEHNKWDAAAVLLGVAVHLKLYPFIYATAVWARLAQHPHSRFGWLSISRSQVRFGVISLAAFSVLNLLMYIIWGQEFIESSYLYHLRRLDHRHNFSAYFYPIYLRFTSVLAAHSTIVSILHHPLVSFIPQMSLTLALGFHYGAQDLPFACFIQTYVFVLFNKVVTSQYFMWYLWFIPLIVRHIKLSKPQSIGVAVIWVSTQVLWLSQAYRLEFLGEPQFRAVWLSSIGFLIGHSWIIGILILGFSPASSSIISSSDNGLKLKKT